MKMPNIAIRSFFILTLNLLWFSGYSQITSVQNGSWSDPATWNTNGIPDSNDRVLIKHFVTVDKNLVVANGELEISESGELCSNHKYVIKQNGKLVNSGVFRVGQMEVEDSVLNFGHIQTTSLMISSLFKNHGSMEVGTETSCSEFELKEGLNDSVSRDPAIASIDIIEERSEEIGLIEIYPNPSNGSFVIETKIAGELKIRITDSKGSIVLLNDNFTDKRLDLSILKSGIYFVEARTPDVVSSKKIVVQR